MVRLLNDRRDRFLYIRPHAVGISNRQSDAWLSKEMSDKAGTSKQEFCTDTNIKYLIMHEILFQINFITAFCIGFVD